MNNLKIILILFSGALMLACQPSENRGVVNEQGESVISLDQDPAFTSDEDLQSYYDNHMSDKQVMFEAVVIKNLPDDNEGSRHQKFLVELNSGQTLLISHNIDLANRINELHKGDLVKIHGEYEWNDRGGVVHWTHHDPSGNHIGGWIEHENKFYD